MKICLYLNHISQIIKDTTGSGSNYTDSYYYCNKIKKRIQKRHCKNCIMYNPLINEA